MKSKALDKIELVNPNDEEVRSQLLRVLDNDEFKRSPKISKFLEYVVTETLEDRQQYIKAHSIAIDVFQKGENFDPQTDPLVRVNAVRLRRMLRHYYSSDGLKDGVILDIIKGSYVPRCYFRDHSETSQEMLSELVKDHSFPTIAVLGFENLSQDSSNSNFGSGITQEIVSQLTKFKELVVIARSAMQLSEDGLVDKKSQSKIIDVRYVLSGSIRIDEDDMRINVELDDRVSHTNIWSHAYNEKLNVKSMLAIQDEIAVHVATTIAQPYGVIIRKELADLERKPANHFSAYELYLSYFQFMRTLAPNDHKIARDALEEAVKIDSQFSDAWSALAVIYASEYQFSMNQIERDVDVRELAYQTARRSLKIDPSNSRSSYAMSVTKWINGDLEGSKRDAEKALRLNPNNSLILAQFGSFIALSGGWDKGLEMLEHAMVMNPAHPDFYHYPFVFNYYRQDMLVEALQEANNTQLPNYFWTHYIKAVIYSALDNQKLATQAAHKLVKLYPEIEKKARFELEKWAMQPELVEKILNGLKKAGLNVV